jgi:hypothetical protein
VAHAASKGCAAGAILCRSWRSDSRQFFARWALCIVHVKRIESVRGLCAEFSEAGSEMEGVGRRRIRTSLAGGWAGVVLPRGRSEGDGSGCASGAGVRGPEASFLNARVAGGQCLSDELCAGSGWEEVFGEHAGGGSGAGADYRGVELDVGGEAVRLWKLEVGRASGPTGGRLARNIPAEW